MRGLPDKDHLDELLDSALAGTFPASDPTSSFVCEGEPPPRKGDATKEGAGPGLPKERPC